MSKINKNNTYATLWLRQLGHTAEQIAEELSLTLKVVNNIIDSNPKSVIPNSDINPKSLMITHTASKRLNNVAIMTKDASALADENRNKSAASQGRNQEKNIFRPNK